MADNGILAIIIKLKAARDAAGRAHAKTLDVVRRARTEATFCCCDNTVTLLVELAEAEEARIVDLEANVALAKAEHRREMQNPDLDLGYLDTLVDRIADDTVRVNEIRRVLGERPATITVEDEPSAERTVHSYPAALLCDVCAAVVAVVWKQGERWLCALCRQRKENA